MGHTYSNILLHIVFSTNDRRPLIRKSFQQRLYEYMAGVARQEFGFALQIGGVADHVHALIRLKTDISIADAMRLWKALSSKWVNETIRPNKRFAWQTGYAAFSVSQSNAPSVSRYIQDQERHHATLSFQDEFLKLLARHGIKFDPQHVWD
jgi:REP-associated tyrosine transposase